MKNANFSKNYILIIVLFLSFLSFANSLSESESFGETFQEESYNLIFFGNESTDYNNRSTEPSSSNSLSMEVDDIITVMNFSYPVYLLLTLFMICELCRIENAEDYRKGIWLFIYLSNNGYIVVSLSIGMFDEFDEMTLYFLIPELVILGLGTIFYLYKLGKGICDNAMETYFSCDAIGFLFKLPCICVWSLIGLTDPCCEQTTYTVTTYEDGHTESTEFLCSNNELFVLFLEKISYGCYHNYILYICYPFINNIINSYAYSYYNCNDIS